MPFFTMAKPKDTTKQSTKGKAVDTEKPPSERSERPGTSGTENLLITSRRQASEQYIKAQRAEKAYRSKKHATLARHNYNETKGHFKEAGSHFILALKGTMSVIKGVPHLFGEKQEDRRRKAEAKKRERHMEQKKKLEEALAKEAGENEEEEDE